MLTRTNIIATVVAVAAVGAYALLRNNGDDARRSDVPPMGRLLTPVSSLKPIKSPAKPKPRKAPQRPELNTPRAESRPAPQPGLSRPPASQVVKSRAPTPAPTPRSAQRPSNNAPDQEETFGG